MPRTCALILPFQPTLHRVSCSNETIQNAPKHYKTHQNMSLRSNGWIVFVRYQKFRCDFVARTFALIAPVQLVCTEFHAVTKQSKMHPNTIKRTNTWVKIPMRVIGCVNCEKFRCDFMAQTCALIAPFHPVLHRVSSINETLLNAPNTTKCSKAWV